MEMMATIAYANCCDGKEGNITAPQDDAQLNFISVANASTHQQTNGAAEIEPIIALGLLFLIIGFVGLAGNALVIGAVLCSRKMRTSVTNLLITNIAFADLIIMAFGIPEITQFIMNKGWVLGEVPCKFNRYALVSSLYASVITLVAVCVERYVAILQPIRAHILCHKRRLVLTIIMIWPISAFLATPTVLFNTVSIGHPDIPLEFCMIIFPGNHEYYFVLFKFIESGLFYVIPLGVQIVLYAIIGKNLFVGTEELHCQKYRADTDRSPVAVTARKGVVKMLISSVAVYFLSYLPQQVLLFYNTFSPRHFQETWSFVVFVMVIAYINSAVNPILYGVFSQNFRKRFKHIIFFWKWKSSGTKRRQSATGSFSTRQWKATSIKAATTDM